MASANDERTRRENQFKNKISVSTTNRFTEFDFEINHPGLIYVILFGSKTLNAKH